MRRDTGYERSLRGKRLSNIGRAVLGNAEGARSTREGKALLAFLYSYRRVPQITQAPARQADMNEKASCFVYVITCNDDLLACDQAP